jgi:hypothetical protein
MTPEGKAEENLVAKINWRIAKPDGDFIERSTIQVGGPRAGHEGGWEGAQGMGGQAIGGWQPPARALRDMQLLPSVTQHSRCGGVPVLRPHINSATATQQTQPAHPACIPALAPMID